MSIPLHTRARIPLKYLAAATRRSNVRRITSASSSRRVRSPCFSPRANAPRKARRPRKQQEAYHTPNRSDLHASALGSGRRAHLRLFRPTTAC
jgi:hypothetical protein